MSTRNTKQIKPKQTVTITITDDGTDEASVKMTFSPPLKDDGHTPGSAETLASRMLSAVMEEE